jgi:hypothetical protein
MFYNEILKKNYDLDSIHTGQTQPPLGFVGLRITSTMSTMFRMAFTTLAEVIVDARLVPKRVINYCLSNRVFLVLWFIWY